MAVAAAVGSCVRRQARHDSSEPARPARPAQLPRITQRALIPRNIITGHIKKGGAECGGVRRGWEYYGDVGTGVGSPPRYPARFFPVDTESHRRRQPASKPGLGAGAGGGGGQWRPQPQLQETKGLSPDGQQPRPNRHGGCRYGIFFSPPLFF